MQVATYIATFALFAVGIYFAWVRLQTVAAYFQQEEYDNARFLRAWPALSLIDFKFTALVIILAVVGLLTSWEFMGLSVAAGGGLALAILEHRGQASMKKPLVKTSRIMRIFWVAFAASLAVLIGLSLLDGKWAVVVMLQLAPLMMIGGNLATAGIQQRENQGYIDQAKAKLARYPGETIGITGSFGKTTVKHALGDVLAQLSTVYFSEGSINTVLGHTRHVRQRLQPAHRYFIAEMGAYGPGSIKRLCDFADPDHAIITSIGLAHNERFKGLQTVARAKAELAEHVGAKGGLVVLTQDVLSYEPFKAVAAQPGARVISVGDDAGQAADYCVSDIQVDAAGTALTLEGPKLDQPTRFSLPLLGAHNQDNLALIAVLLLELGFGATQVQMALGGVRPVPHRLQPKAGPNGSAILDDAYNANPTGMRNAFELSAQMAADKGRQAMAITPGITELGEEHERVHAELGAHAARLLDRVIAVTPERIESFVEGFEDAQKAQKAEGGESAGRLETANSYLQARAMVDPDLGANDVLLIANDLPDLLGQRVWL